MAVIIDNDGKVNPKLLPDLLVFLQPPSKALFEAMMSDKFGNDDRNVMESAYVDKLEVDFGICCMLSAGQAPALPAKS